MAIHSRALKALEAVLPAKVSVEQTTHGTRIGDVDVDLLWAGAGWPSYVEQALADPAIAGRHRVVVAERMGKSAQAIAEKAGAGWADETGAARISFPTIVIARDGHIPPLAPASWTRATLTVVEALLAHDVPATVSAVVLRTGLSQRTCSIALRLLTDQGFLSSPAKRGRRSGRVVDRPSDLLDAYCHEYLSLRPRPAFTLGASERELDEQVRSLGSAIENAGYNWGLTGVSAAQIYAPFLTSTGRATVLVGADTSAELISIARHAGLTTIVGGRLTLRPFTSRTKNNLCKTIDGVRLAPWPSVVADTRQEGVRGEDVADHLRVAMLSNNG